VECTEDGTEMGVEMAVVTSVVVSTGKATVSWVVLMEQTGETGKVGKATETEVVVTDSLLPVSRLMASSVYEILRSVPSGEPVQCTGDGTKIGVQMAVVTSVVVSTDELTTPATLSWVVKLEQSGADGEVGEVTVTEVVTAAAATTEYSASAALPVAAATAGGSNELLRREERYQSFGSNVSLS